MQSYNIWPFVSAFFHLVKPDLNHYARNLETGFLSLRQKGLTPVSLLVQEETG